MVNLYAYTYPSAITKFDGFILTKVGDSHRNVDIRMNEQGGAAEYEEKIKIHNWDNLQKIDRDYRVHEILTQRGLHHTDGKGTEWFKIPAKNLTEVFEYLDQIVTQLEGRVVRKTVKLRKLQERALDQAMDIIDNVAQGGSDSAGIIANLCPRFGKTIWALMLFNRITEKYKNKVMLLPAYWLSAHSSFESELNQYSDFLDMKAIDVNSENPWVDAGKYMREGKRLVIPISLHGDLEEWKKKHQWISTIPNSEIFNFADEGDFGTHTENQVAKLNFLFQ